MATETYNAVSTYFKLKMDNNEVEDIHSIGSSCNSDSTESEERLKRLFDNCDRNKDGFIDRFVLLINNSVVLMF